MQIKCTRSHYSLKFKSIYFECFMKYIRGVVDMNSVYILTRPYLSIGLIPKRVKYFLYGNNFARFPINCFPYDSIGL